MYSAVAPGHRDRPGVARLAREDALSTDDPDDPPRQAHGRACALEDRALLDVHLEEAGRRVAVLDEGRAADAARLLLPEDRNGALADALDRLDRRDDPECAVELAALGHRVEVGAGPDGGLLGAADQVARTVDLHREAGVAHPAGGEVVGLILVRSPADPVRTGTAADGVELL